MMHLSFNISYFTSICTYIFQAIRVFFLVRDLSLSLLQEEERQLPLTKDKDCVKIDNILDLSK
jgi:hypothetical protein